ncbi:hypothetical protein EON65_05705 [archaeon]|nr:MAG: hypothetical protein EON65_05705 [archaeon]
MKCSNLALAVLLLAIQILITSSLVHNERRFRVNTFKSFTILSDSSRPYDIIGASESLYDWIRKESLSSVVSKQNLLSSINEIRSDCVFTQKLQAEFDYIWPKVSAAIEEENRSLKDIIGDKITTKVLKFVESINIYEPTSVTAFLSTPVFESMLGEILYEGIIEFIQKADIIIGTIINKMPIIGAIRQAVIKEIKANLDITLRVQIKSFLSSFNKVAVQRMVEFILSTQNQKALEKANANLVGFLLNKKVKDVFPTQGEDNRRLKQFVWNLLLFTPIEDIDRILSVIYEKLDGQPISSILRIEFRDFIDASPTGERVLVDIIERFFRSSEGDRFKNSLRF